jgi:hypothetical protein
MLSLKLFIRENKLCRACWHSQTKTLLYSMALTLDSFQAGADSAAPARRRVGPHKLRQRSVAGCAGLRGLEVAAVRQRGPQGPGAPRGRDVISPWRLCCILHSRWDLGLPTD